MTVVFVYGTLRPGQPNHSVAAPGVADRVGAHGQGLRLYAAAHYGFPYATTGHPDDIVVGALLTLHLDRSPAILRRLDYLEGYDPDHPDRGHYLRRRRTFVTDQPSQAGPAGTPLEAWVYLAGPTIALHSLHHITSGDWAHQTPSPSTSRAGRSCSCVACSV